MPDNVFQLAMPLDETFISSSVVNPPFPLQYSPSIHQSRQSGLAASKDICYPAFSNLNFLSSTHVSPGPPRLPVLSRHFATPAFLHSKSKP
jgi:hypothetical protein